MTTADPDDGPPLEFELPVALSELLLSYVRQQESDLRLLSIIEKHIETFDERDARIAAELVEIDTRLDPAQVRRMVEQVTDLYFTKIARGEPLEETLEATHELATTLSKQLTNDLDGIAFAAELMRACSDEADSSRMRTNVLMGAVAGFEGLLLTLLRIVAVGNPEWLNGNPPTARTRLTSKVVVKDRVRAADVQILIEKKSKGGWKETCKAYAIFGITLPERPTIIQVASEARNAAAHRNGALRETLALSRADGEPLAFDLAADFTADHLRELLDTQIAWSIDLALHIFERFDASDASKSGAMLGGLQYELLKRGRSDAGAATAHFHRRARFVDDTDRRRSQVNGWLALLRQGRQREYRRELDSWGKEVESTSFELARLVLLNQRRKARSRARQMRAQGELSERDWQTWPLFDGIREGMG